MRTVFTLSLLSNSQNSSSTKSERIEALKESFLFICFFSACSIICCNLFLLDPKVSSEIIISVTSGRISKICSISFIIYVVLNSLYRPFDVILALQKEQLKGQPLDANI